MYFGTKRKFKESNIPFLSQYISELAKHSFWNELWSLSYHSKLSWLLYPLHPIFNAILLSFWKNYVSREFIDVVACRSSFNLPLDNTLSTSTDAVISRCRIEWPWDHTNLSVIVCYWWQFFKELFIFHFLFPGYIQTLSILQEIRAFLWNIRSVFFPRTFYMAMFYTCIAA